MNKFKYILGITILSLSFFFASGQNVKTVMGVDNAAGGGGGGVVAFNAASGTADLGGTTLSWTHDVGSGSNRGLFVGVGWMFGAATITGVTFDGVAMTPVWAETSTSITNKSCGFILVSPNSGSHTVEVTFASAVNDVKAGVAISFTGVHQTVPVGTPQTTNAESGTNPAVTVGGVGAGDFLVDFLAAWGSTAIAVDADQTSRYESEGLSSNNQYLGGSTQPGTAGGVMSWTASASSYHAYGAVAIKPAP
jgi:hypothetical protein